MPTTSLRSQPPVDHPAPKKYVLVVSCMDARLLDDLGRFLDHDNLTNRYYHLTFAGAALGLTTKHVKLKAGLPQPPDFKQWRQAFLDQVRATIALTKGELLDIYIVQHEDCGAFKLLIKGFEEMPSVVQRKLNRRYADALVQDIKDLFCTEFNPKTGVDDCRFQPKPPTVRSFFMDLRGNVTKLGRSYVPKAGAKGEKCENHCTCVKWAKGAPSGESADGPTEEVAPLTSPSAAAAGR